MKSEIRYKNIKLIIEYDGSQYSGWQRQKNCQSIQGIIESAISTMTGQSVPLVGSGRTDAGVHAWQQVANFKCHTRLTPENFMNGLNSLLPKDIAIQSCGEVPVDFHSRYNVQSKIYRYYIGQCPHKMALFHQYCWSIPHKLDMDAMQNASLLFKGTHDFKSFEGAGSPRSTSVRTVLRSQLTVNENQYLIYEIEADGFLRFMVRNIVGTLVEIGKKRMRFDAIPNILTSRNRHMAGPTAPPHGLFLMAVKY
ncbi:MAG: tRNA pseudouridine synthase A [Candidatus Magnetoglobus multicellularis str. Araruama]|uniref:tRNA pseudouridine synthase A n=1 Tax=Candidatus Magnetoglobus multicellularis str. Araruama TaxID=890399 RepID=A0A1V1PGM3_9BACT|nr:MAG: tRNA pseudouridine synthase A [Candidatus Magnetoglobus multicellularis str. Araruama]